jgi:hypothetical protein
MDKTRPDDSELIDDAEDLPTPSHQGSAGGGMARAVGVRDEEKSLAAEDPLPTSVDASDKPADGDLPTNVQTRE